MRKLWTNTVPGKDIAADIIFHYHQELPKLLRGYHKCTKDDAVRLAALIYRVRFGENKGELQIISNMLHEMVPSDLIKIQPPSEWKKVNIFSNLDHCESLLILIVNFLNSKSHKSTLWTLV